MKNNLHSFSIERIKLTKGFIPLFWLCLLLFSFNLSYAQKEKKKKQTINFADVKDDKDFGRFRYIDVKGHSGVHIYSGETLGDAVSSGYGAFEVRYGWQPSKADGWAQYYGSMSYGVGFYTGYIGDPKIFGNPNALYGFADFVTSKYRVGRKTTWHMIPAFGLTYNLVPYDPVLNPSNDAIGGKAAVYFCVGFGANTVVSRELDLTYGVDFTHFSNGRMNTPNYGLNMFGLNLGMRYHYNADQHKIDDSPFSTDLLQARYNPPQRKPKEKVKESSFNFYAAMGWVENYTDAEDGGDPEEKFQTFSGVVDYRYRFDTMHGITLGVDFFYDQSLRPNYPDPSDRWLYGIHAGYDFYFWKIAIRPAVGTYFGEDGDKGKKPLFARVALQYNITDWMNFQVGLKTRRGFAADWVEFGVGFTPFRW